MKKIKLLLFFTLLLFSSTYLWSQEHPSSADDLLMLFSAHTSVEQLNEFISESANGGLLFTLHEVEWKNSEELRRIHFDVRGTNGKIIFEPSTFNYNGINNNEILIISAKAGEYGSALAPFDLLQFELWDIVTKTDDKAPIKMISNFRPMMAASKDMNTTELFQPLHDYFQDLLVLREKIRADKDFTNKTPNYHYYYNDRQLTDSFYLPIQDMTATVEFKNDEDGYASMYFHSDLAIPSIAYRSNK